MMKNSLLASIIIFQNLHGSWLHSRIKLNITNIKPRLYLPSHIIPNLIKIVRKKSEIQVTKSQALSVKRSMDTI